MNYLCYCSFHPPVSIESESIYDLLEIHYRSFHIQMAQDSKVLWSFRFLPNWTQFHFTSPSPPPSTPSPPLNIMFVSLPLLLCSVILYSGCLHVKVQKSPQKVNKTPLELLFCSRVTSLSLKYTEAHRMEQQEVGLDNLYHWENIKYGTHSQLMVNDILLLEVVKHLTLARSLSLVSVWMTVCLLFQ